MNIVMLGGYDGFTFPSDWQKIRESMIKRRDEEIGARFGFSYESGENLTHDGIRFIQEEATSPPFIIDPIMLEVMRIAEQDEHFVLKNDLLGRSAFEDVQPIVQPFRGSDAVWNLTMNLVRLNLTEGTTGNSLFSPISILSTLNILLLATRGQTFEEIRTVLGYPRYTGLVHSQFHQMLKSLALDIGVTVSTSNALFVQVDFPISDSFQSEVNHYYGNLVDLIRLDFTRRPVTTMRLMNRLISSQTNRLIESMFTEPVAEDSKLVLSNAVYFNGSWEYEFLFNPPEFTGIEIQFRSFNKNIGLTLMSANLDFPYLADSSLGFQIASLPYAHNGKRDEVSEAHMFLILPNMEGEEGLAQLEQNLLSADWEEVFARMEPVYGEIQIPRMKIEFQTNLAPTLANLGLRRLFSGEGSPDFQPLTPQWRDFRLDTLQHKTVLKITEKGTEAAAATSAFQFRMAPFKTFKADRPFLLFIYDSLNKIVIFWSRVVEPTPLLSGA